MRAAGSGAARPMQARRGMTLVEAALAGALAVLAVLGFMEGLIVSTRIAHENSELLAAEAYAWDTAWKWLNKKNDDLNQAEAWMYYPNVNGLQVASNACPAIYREDSPAKCFVRIRKAPASEAVPAEVSAKEIEVDVEWGPAGSRLRLGSLGAATARSFNVQVAVLKGEVDRAE